MPNNHLTTACGCGRLNRRTFLADVGMGFTGLALGAMLERESRANPLGGWTPPDGAPVDVAISPSLRRIAWIAGGRVRWIERGTAAP